LLTFSNAFCHALQFCDWNNYFPLFQQISQGRITASIFIIITLAITIITMTEEASLFAMVE
jgi:hypothetical protein